MTRIRRNLFLVVAIACLAGPSWTQAVSGQAVAGEIRLDVRDPSGARMQASGTLQNLSTGVVRPFQTVAEGTLTLPNLPLGPYRVEVSRAGFETQSLVVELTGTAPVSRTVTLAIGAAAARVDVVATTPLPGSDLNVRDIPAPVQTATQQDIRNSMALDL